MTVSAVQIMRMFLIVSHHAHDGIVFRQCPRCFVALSVQAHDDCVCIQFPWCFGLHNAHDALMCYNMMPIMISVIMTWPWCSDCVPDRAHDAFVFITCCHWKYIVLSYDADDACVFTLMLHMLSFVIKWCPRTPCCFIKLCPWCLACADDAHVP